MAVINIDDAYILGETGAQVDKVTGLFTKDEGTTEEEKSFAQLNIGASGGGGGGGRNLLDNGWFTIDQTSITSGAATGATAQDVRDRWRLARCSEYTFNNDGTVTSKWDGTGAGCYLIQYALLDNAAFYKGKTCTLSFYADGELYTKTLTMPTGATESFTLGGVSVNIADRTSSDRGYECQFYHSVSAGKTLGPFKLEEGSVSTLANDGPPDKRTEFLKCASVFFRAKGEPLGMGYISSGMATIYASIPAAVPMRAVPSVSFGGTIFARIQGGTINIASLSATSPMTTGSAVGVTGALASSASATGPCAIYGSASAYIDFSCRPS